MWDRCNAEPFVANIRFTRSEFDDLHNELKPLLDQPLIDDDVFVRGTLRCRPRDRRLGTSDALFLFLMRATGRLRLSTLAMISGFSVGTLSAHLHHVAAAICKGLEYEIRWPTVAERRQLHGKIAKYSWAVAIIDGTYQWLRRPQEAAVRSIYLRKDKKRAFWLHQVCALLVYQFFGVADGGATFARACIQIVIDYRGKVIQHSYVPGAVTNDRGAFNQTIGAMAESLLSSRELIIADAGYRGAGPLLVCHRCVL